MERNINKKIVFIFSRFPSIWQPYLSREIDGLIKKNLPVIIISIKNKKWKKIQSEALEIEEKIQILNCGYLFSIKIIIGNMYFILNNPIKYFRTLFFIIKNSIKGRKTTCIKNLLLFPKSVYFAYKIKNMNVCHIHATHATFATLISSIIFKLTSIPYSFAGHASDIYADRTMLEEKIKMAKFIITCTDENIKYLKNSFSEPLKKNIFLNYHGINLDRFQYIEKRPSMPLKILSVGRIEKSKGYIDLIEAVHLLKKGNIIFEAIIVGKGPLLNQLKDKIKEYRLENNVIITGAIPYDEVIDYYKEATIFILPAREKYHYGIPNVVIEAMASGLPVITTKLPAVENELIVDRVNGILINEKSPQEIVESIRYLSDDADTRNKIAFNARKTVEDKFDFNKNIEQLYNIFCDNILYKNNI